MASQYTEKDLDELISKKLHECDGLPVLCRMIQNDEGRERIAKRVKQIIISDGIHDVSAAMAQLESQLEFEIETE